MIYILIFIAGILLGIIAAQYQVRLAAKSAHTDTLTGVYNRALLDKTLGRLVAAADRDKKHLALMMMDLNNFKKANDRYGHQFGDLVLQSVTQEIVKVVRKSDFIFRYGGDEFMVILPATTKLGARRVAEKIRDQVISLALQTPRGTTFESIDLSIGIAAFPDDAAIDLDLIKKADDAVYRAKDKRDHIEVAK